MHPIDFPYIDDFCDDEVFVFSTMGKGPSGEVGNPGPQGPQGEKGDPGKDGILSFDTVADMQASTDLEVGMTVHTNGFHEIGDGGAAYYIISAIGTIDDVNVLDCASGLYAILVNDINPVNVLMLGFDNTGQNDISTLFNTYTEKFPLYFPNGIYKVSNTLVLKNSIYGDSFARYPISSNADNMAIFDSYDNDVTLSISGVLGITISNIAIYCNASETAISIAGSNGGHYIKNVNISNLQGIGLNVNPDSGLSRCVYVDGLFVNGKSNFPNSIGIVFNNKAYDSRIDNIEIMRVQKGIVTECTIYGNNIHLWGGTTINDTPSPAWINGNIGLTVNNTTAVLGNLYVDTFKTMITSSGYCHVHVNGFICMCDGTINYNDQALLTNLLDSGIIQINGGFIRYGNGFIGITGIGTRRNVLIENVTIDSSEQSIFNKTSYQQYEIAHNVYHVVPRLSVGYVFMFAIKVRYNDKIIVKVNQYESEKDFIFIVNGNTITASKTNDTADWGYVFDSTTKTIKVYKYYSTPITSLAPFSFVCENMISYLIDTELISDRVKGYYFANYAEAPSGYVIIPNA